jgi:hypothetical protein
VIGPGGEKILPGEEFNIVSNDYLVTTFFILGPDEKTIGKIHCLYDDDGCWSFALAKFEGCSLDLSASARESDLNDYSMELELDIPDGYYVVNERDM